MSILSLDQSPFGVRLAAPSLDLYSGITTCSTKHEAQCMGVHIDSHDGERFPEESLNDFYNVKLD